MGWQDAPVVEPKWAAAPEVEPSMLHKAGAAVLRGIPGGLPGVVASMAGEGLSQGTQALEKSAYKAGGAVTDLAAGAGASPEVAGGLGYATNVAVQAIPTIASGIPAKMLSKPMEATAQRVMQSALKPSSEAIVSGDAAKAIDTLLREGANVTPGGAAKLGGLVNKLNAEVQAKIAASPDVVDKAHAMSEVYKTLAKFRNQVNPATDQAAILKSWQEFNNLVGAKIPIQQAQALKQGTYRVLADKYAKSGAVDNEAATQAQMSMARGLRMAIEEKIPEVAKLNAREASIINALELAERRAGVAGNRDMAGIAWLASNPKAAAAMMADRSPLFKSILARMIYKGKDQVPPAVARAMAGAYMAEQGQSE